MTLPTPKGGGFLGSLNSVEVSPYSLTCALIPKGNAKLPLPCYPKVSGYFYSYIALLNASSSWSIDQVEQGDAPAPKTVSFQPLIRFSFLLKRKANR